MLDTYVCNGVRSDEDVENRRQKHGWECGHEWSAQHQVLPLWSNNCAQWETGEYYASVHQSRHNDRWFNIPNCFNQRTSWQACKEIVDWVHRYYDFSSHFIKTSKLRIFYRYTYQCKTRIRLNTWILFHHLFLRDSLKMLTCTSKLLIREHSIIHLRSILWNGKYKNKN